MGWTRENLGSVMAVYRRRRCAMASTNRPTGECEPAFYAVNPGSSYPTPALRGIGKFIKMLRQHGARCSRHGGTSF